MSVGLRVKRHCYGKPMNFLSSTHTRSLCRHQLPYIDVYVCRVVNIQYHLSKYVQMLTNTNQRTFHQHVFPHVSCIEAGSWPYTVEGFYAVGQSLKKRTSPNFNLLNPMTGWFSCPCTVWKKTYFTCCPNVASCGHVCWIHKPFLWIVYV